MQNTTISPTSSNGRLDFSPDSAFVIQPSRNLVTGNPLLAAAVNSAEQRARRTTEKALGLEHAWSSWSAERAWYASLSENLKAEFALVQAADRAGTLVSYISNVPLQAVEA